MDLREQKYVCTLARTGNLTKAAAQLYISQPALSSYISNLEKNLGVALFDRIGKKFVLTYAGERYVEHASVMLEHARCFEAELADIRLKHSGRIRIGIPTRRGPFLLPAVVAQFEKEWPGVEVVIWDSDLATLKQLLRDFKLDLVILNKDDTTEDMETHLLFREEFLLAVPPAHPLNQKAKKVPGSRYQAVCPADLNGQTLILQTESQSIRRIEDEIIKKHQIVPGRVRVICGIETAMQMVAEGLGIGFVREGYAVKLEYSKPVHYYTLDTENHQKELVAAHKKGIQLPGYAQAMIQLFQDYGRTFLRESQQAQ